MKSSIWGPYAWITLHTIPLNSMIQNRKTCPFAKEWLHLLRSILPCAECQKHLGWYLADHPPSSQMTPQELHHYICQLHNHVSAANGSAAWPPHKVHSLYGFNPENPSSSQLRSWSRNWLLFLYLALHSPQTNYQDLLKFAHITGQQFPWNSANESKLWDTMLAVAPSTRAQAFAWFEEFRPQWFSIWKQQQPRTPSHTIWPPSLIESPYLKRMKWMLAGSERNVPPALGSWVSLPVS